MNVSLMFTFSGNFKFETGLLGRYPGEAWGKKCEICKCVFIFSKSEAVVV